jgi:hypothetical protein
MDSKTTSLHKRSLFCGRIGLSGLFSELVQGKFQPVDNVKASRIIALNDVGLCELLPTYLACILQHVGFTWIGYKPFLMQTYVHHGIMPGCIRGPSAAYSLFIE